MISDQQPKSRQLILADALALGSGNTPQKPKRQYRPRGACGAFSGNRPPKRLHLKAAFDEKHVAHQVHLQEKVSQKSQGIKDRAYHKFMKEMLPLQTGTSPQDRFRSVAQKWKDQVTSGQDSAASMAAENRAVV